MTKDEGRVYLHLLQAGPSKVGQLAPYFEGSRSKLYRRLDDLNRKGFVSKTPERPTVYHPVFPRDAFEIGRGTLDRRYEYLESVREEVLPVLERLHRPADEHDPADWNKIEGAERIYEVIQRLVGEAEDSLWVASNHEPAVSPWLPFVREAWSIAEQKVHEEDVRARFLLSPEEADLESLPGWVLSEDRMRILDVEDPVHFTIVDREAVVFWVQAAPARGRGGENVAIHTDATGPVTTHVALFERLWEEASAPDGASAGSEHEPPG